MPLGKSLESKPALGGMDDPHDDQRTCAVDALPGHRPILSRNYTYFSVWVGVSPSAFMTVRYSTVAEMEMAEKQFAHILVIDDSEEYAYFLVKTIRKYDPQLVVVVAFTAEQGLLSVRKHDYDLILCDFKLPGITGLSFLKLCKELRPQTPVVVFTGYDADELEKEAKRQGAFAFLHKPARFVILSGVIRDALTYRERLRSKPA